MNDGENYQQNKCTLSAVQMFKKTKVYSTPCCF